MSTGSPGATDLLRTARNVSLLPTSAQDRVSKAFLDLQAIAPFSLAALTFRRSSDAQDQVLRSYGMTREHIEDGITSFIPRSTYFRRVREQPDAILDWTQVPDFRDSPLARDHLVSIGITQGMSFVLTRDDQLFGTAHFNFSGITDFTDAQYRALDATRSNLTTEVSAYVTAGDIGLTRREREVLRRIAVGATNVEISDDFGISRSTVKAHVEAILAKLRVSNRVQAARAALLLGLD